MAKYNKVTTYSNANLASSESVSYDDSDFVDGAVQIDVLGLDTSAPTSATLFSIGTTDVTSWTVQGAISVPTELLTAYSSGNAYASAKGASISISGGLVIYGAEFADSLGAGVQGTDTFYYAVQAASGTIAWNQVTVTLTGSAAYLQTYQSAGFVVEAQNWSTGTDVLSDSGAIVAYSASGNLTGITVTGNGTYGSLTFGATVLAAGSNSVTLTAADTVHDDGVSDLGSHFFDNGQHAYDFTYDVDESAVYATHAGYGEVAFTDNWSITTTNLTTATLSETAYGSIHTADAVAFSFDTAGPVTAGDTIGIDVDFTDHDENANLTATISGVPDGDTLVYHHGSDANTSDETFSGATASLSAAQLAALGDAGVTGATLSLIANVAGTIDLSIDVQNAEFYIDASEADVLGNDALASTIVTLNGATVTYAGSDTGTVDANNQELYSHTATTDTTADTGALTVNAAVVNHAPNTPSFVPSSTLVGANAGPFGNFTATDPDAGDTVSYFLQDTDSTLKTTIGNVTIDSATGALSATSNTDQIINVVAEDNHGAVSDAVTFKVIVGTSGDNTVLTSDLQSTDNIEAGLAGSDHLNGSNGIDYLFGGTDSDFLTGNGGGDWLVGGNGHDTFNYLSASDSTHSAFDTITNFTLSGGNSDTIDFAPGLGFSLASVAGNLGSATTLDAHKIGWVTTGGNTILYANTGSGTEAIATGADVMEIHLNGILDLAGHFSFT